MSDEYSLISDDFEPRSNFPVRPPNIENVPMPSVSDVSILSDRPYRSQVKWSNENLSPKNQNQQQFDSRNQQQFDSRNQQQFDSRNQQQFDSRNQQQFDSRNHTQSYSYNNDTASTQYEQLPYNPRRYIDTYEKKFSSPPIQSARSHSVSLPEYSRINKDESSKINQYKGSSFAEDNLKSRYPEPNLEYSSAKRNSIENYQQKLSKTTSENVPTFNNQERSSAEDFQQKNQRFISLDFVNKSCAEDVQQKIQRSKSPKQQNYNKNREYQNDNFCQAVEKYPKSCHNHTVNCCTGNNSNSMDSAETVRNWFMLIHNQNEQIKSLQSQLDRLLKIHEEILREKKNCTCSASNDKSNIEEGKQEMKQKNERSPEEKPNPTYIEQKVSIGVMTSFEFKVQNNQHVEVEEKESVEDFRNKTKRHIHPDFEARKKQTPIISRRPNGLENISEDTESHLSSSHPRSSNNLLSERRSLDQVDDNYGKSEDFLQKTMNSHGKQNTFSQNYDRTAEDDYKRKEDTNIQDGRDFSDESSDEGSPLKHTPNVGWTFYNNVLNQVNKILRNSSLEQEEEENEEKGRRGAVRRSNFADRKLDIVKAATLEQLAKMGISDVEKGNSPSRKKLHFDAPHRPKLERDLNLAQGTSFMSDTNTSMKIKALALKYLNDEQLTDIAVQRQRTEALKQVVMSNVDDTNLSMATMKYLQKYQLLQGIPTNFEEHYEEEVEHNPAVKFTEKRKVKPKIVDQRSILKNPQSPRDNRILDITTLKNRPKLR